MEPFRDLVFVAMPFGKRKNEHGTITIDFDHIYASAIKPAAEKADVDVLRGDDEATGGIIHISIYERLLLAEIVIADLTLSTPNVYYEVGVRHATRPRSTILIFAREHVSHSGRLPFDIEPIRAIPYELDPMGRLLDTEVDRLQEVLEARIRHARSDRDRKDSPLFQLIRDYPGVDLPHEVTDAFKERVGAVTQRRDEIDDAVAIESKVAAIRRLREIDQDFSDLQATPPELVVKLLLAYRDVEAWGEMISLAERIPHALGDLRVIEEQLAFALNRRRGPKDQERAIKILRRVIDREGENAESCGLLGRIYKDRFELARQDGDEYLAKEMLDEAIATYRIGFQQDPRDYYPGINLVTLLLRRGTDESYREAERLWHVVAFAVARRGGLHSDDYWSLATLLELAVIDGDEELARRALARIKVVDHHDWMTATTARNLRILRDCLSTDHGALAWLDDAIRELAASEWSQMSSGESLNA